MDSWNSNISSRLVSQKIAYPKNQLNTKLNYMTFILILLCCPFFLKFVKHKSFSLILYHSRKIGMRGRRNSTILWIQVGSEHSNYSWVILFVVVVATEWVILIFTLWMHEGRLPQIRKVVSSIDINVKW